MKKRLKTIALLLGLYLGLHNGYIALWKTGTLAPLEVFPYRAELYPKTDQTALERGIEIDNQQSLAKLLEDYLS